MKICKVCLQSDMLCGACSRKLEEGSIKRVDVDLSRAIHTMSKDGFDADFLYAEENTGRVYVVVESRHAARFIGPGGRNIKKLSAILGKQIKLLEKSQGSDKHVMEKLLGVQVLGINKIYTSRKTFGEHHAAAGESLKVRIEKRFMRNVQPLAGVAGRVLNKKISFIFE